MEELNKLTKKQLIDRVKSLEKQEPKEEKPKNTIQIKNRYTDEVIYECEAESLKEVVKKAVKEEADLSWANLSRADLSKADLSEANLSKADLSKADLSWANLSKADLSEADYWKTNLWNIKGDKKTREQLIKIMNW